MYVQEAGNSKYAYKKGTDINTNLTNTGINGDEVCKINDMSSNLREWTTENSNYTGSGLAHPYTGREGNFYDSNNYTAYRYSGYSNYITTGIGFRLILYLNV